MSEKLYQNQHGGVISSTLEVKTNFFNTIFADNSLVVVWDVI